MLATEQWYGRHKIKEVESKYYNLAYSQKDYV